MSWLSKISASSKQESPDESVEKVGESSVPEKEVSNEPEKKDVKDVVPEKEVSNEPVKEERQERRKASEIFNNINDAVKEKFGMSYFEAQDLKSFDVDSDDHDELDIFAKGIKLKDPGISKKELDYKMSKYDLLFKSDDDLKEMLENEEITKEQFNALDAEFTGELRRAKEAIKGKQDEIDIDSIELEFSNENKEPENNGPTEEQIQEVTSRVSSALSSYDKETFVIKDKDGNVALEYDHVISDEDRSEIVKSMMDPRGWNQFFGEAKSDDEAYKQMAQIFFKLKHFDRITKSIYDKAKSAGNEETVKGISNIDFDDKSKVVKDSTDKFAGVKSVFGRRH